MLRGECVERGGGSVKAPSIPEPGKAPSLATKLLGDFTYMQ